ncbi:hypothetical protein L1987_67257 [Smallanthus sonchifolius]|uniref:Uncharacterized protein n=1 Tax=Smallanthus sonchifolius TaxID=185202 RepID=A0ACB9B235_9ASTR|nr:hypothetical protein L1987_67257 [Smallanthus sonchifolius]
MPRKKDQPTSALPPRRSARGLSRSASSDGDDSVELVYRLWGSKIPRRGCVSISSNESVRDVIETRYERPLKILILLLEIRLPENRALQESGSLKVSDGIGHAEVGLDPPRTPLFSPEFKAMLSRDYPKTSMVFRPNAPPQTGSVLDSCDLWDGVAQSHTQSERKGVSKPPEVRMRSPAVHGHVSKEGLELVHVGHELHGEVGENLLHEMNRVDGMHASTKVVHGGLGELPMQPPEVDKVVPNGGLGLLWIWLMMGREWK